MNPDDRIGRGITPQLDAWMDRFELCKPRLLKILRAASGNSEVFDADKTWVWIETYAVNRWANDTAARHLEKPADRRERLNQLSITARETRQLLERLITERPNGTISEAGGDVLDAWLRVKPNGLVSGALGVPTGRWAALEQLARLVASLQVLETAAIDAAAQNRKYRGRPRGSGSLPQEDIWRLARIYSESTGREPTTTVTGQFMAFLAAVIEVAGIEIGDGMNRAVKLGLRSYRGARS